MTRAARWWKPALAGLVVLGAAAAGLWTRQAFRARPAVVATPLIPRPVAIVPGVYLLGESSPAAAYVVETAEGLILIDSGLEASAETVTGQLARLGLDAGRVRAILLTHGHADHCLGAERLRSQTGAKVYAGRGDCVPLREGGPREAFFSTFHMPQLDCHPTTVDVELEGEETLSFGDTRFRVIATPGHTPGSVCYLLERPGLQALFAGDVVQHLSSARDGVLGTYAAYLPPLYRGNVGDYLASLRRLRALPCPDLVLPGHPQMDPIPQSPHLPAERWHALLETGITEMERLLARYEADGANFLDGQPKELLPGLHYLGDFGGSAVYCLNTPKGLCLFDAPGGALLLEFVDRRLKKLGLAGREILAVLLTSADPAATAGLAAVVERTRCRVVAPQAGLEDVRRVCPDQTALLTEADLEKLGWFEIKAIPLQGRGTAPTAYQYRWGGKTVLVSGRIPVKLSTPTAEQLMRELLAAPGRPGQYAASLDRLEGVNPDVWLPAVPVHGQNANLYDRDWAAVLGQNRQLLRPMLR
jgi:glyoxylase-like metal-dependent hydrolase (beta-lactamase superfamily II)